MRSVAKWRARVICAAAIFSGGPAVAQPVVVADSGDSAWLLAASLGACLAALAGALRTGRDDDVRLTRATICAGTILLWVLVGHSLAFGAGSLWIGGFANLALGNLADMRVGMTVPQSLEILFQLGMALTTIMLVTGPFAGRLRSGWLIGFAMAWLLLVYIPIARADSDGGWFGGAGTLDFAGALPMLLASGIAVTIVQVLGGPGRAERETPAFPWLAVLAVLAGANMAADSDTVHALVITLSSCSATVLVWIMAGSRKGHRADLGAAVLTGLALVAPNASYIEPAGGILVGAVGGAVCFAVSRFAARRLGAGDGDTALSYALGVVIGMLALPLLVLPALGGRGFDAGISLGGQFITQLIATGATMIWAGGVTTVVALMVAMIIPMTTADAPQA